MPASNAFYFFDNGFRKTNANRTFFLNVFEALGAGVGPIVPTGPSTPIDTRSLRVVNLPRLFAHSGRKTYGTVNTRKR